MRAVYEQHRASPEHPDIDEARHIDPHAFGISSVIVASEHVDTFAPVVAALRGR